MKRIRKLLLEQAGMTLVELIVSFALLAILMTAAVAAINPAAKTFYQMSNMSRAQSVSGLLIDKISGELTSAVGDIVVGTETIEYSDKNGNKVIMSVDTNGKLLLSYEGEGEDQTEWYFTEKVYMGNVIKSDGLKFAVVDSGKKTIRVTLKLKNTKTSYEYEREVVIQCCNSATEVKGVNN